MGALYEYQLWLTKLQRQPTFLNNYWCAMLAHDMEENKHSEGFKIPYFIVEKELMREDNNVHLTNRGEAYVSPALRHWLIELLKTHNENTSSTNYEEVLRDVLENKIHLPVSRPLQPSISFHNLPSECKLWIFYMLWSHKKPIRSIRTISTDQLGNSYFIAPSCRLYVSMARTETNYLPIDEARLNREPWGPLYRFVHNQPCRILCENQDGWDVVMKMLQHFQLTNLCYSLLPEITAKLTEQNLIVMMRNEQQRAFEESLAKLASNVDDGAAEKLNRKQKRQKQKEQTASEEKAAVKAVETDFKTMNVKEPVVNKPSNEMNPRAIQKIGKCWNFPQCPLKQSCQYTHPKLPCTKFPNCPRGWQCLFLHEFCPNDAYCVDLNCAYEHVHSKPTYYRAPRDQEPVVNRPVASVPPTVRKVSNQLTKKENEQPPRSPTTPAGGQRNNQPNEKNMRCQYFPKWCHKGNACKFFHPTQQCKILAAGKKCPGQRCMFLHGACAKDGSCTDLTCIYDHYKSKPVVERRLAANQQKQGSLSRATSLSNLSTVSGGRRKSISVDLSDDESDLKKPAGILRAPVGNTRERCHFGVQCTKVRCEYTHPKEKCKAFPKCPNGGACMFLHEVCKKDGVCIKEDCDFEHYLPHNINKRWCNKGSRCVRNDCTYLHPKDCVGKCPTPGNCWMRHRSGAAVAPAAAKAAKGGAPKATPKPSKASATPNKPVPPPKATRPPTAGVGARDVPPPVPPRGASAAPPPSSNSPRQPPPSHNAPPPAYPHGPPSLFPPGPFGNYGPPQFPPPPGAFFGPGPGMGPGGNFGPNHGYGGYGPGGPRPGDAPPPVMFPPPPYPDMSAEDREKLDHMNRR